MRVELVFDDPLRFKLAYDGFRSWAMNPQNANKRDKTHRKKEVEIVRAFNAISEPVGERSLDDDFDFRARKLKTDGDHKVVLSGSAYSLLKERLEDAPMRLEVVVEHDELLEWLEGSKTKVEE